MDYSIIALQNCMCIEESFNNYLQEKMYLESEFILGCIESCEIVLEAELTTDKDDNTTSKMSFIDRIINAIKMLIGKFREKVGSLTKDNEKWLQDAKGKLEEFNKWGEINVKARPIWKTEVATFKSTFDKIDSIINNRYKSDVDVEKFKDLDEMKKLLSQFSDGDNLSEGLKNHFRFGNPDSKKIPEQISISGEEAKRLCLDLYTYCIRYDNETLPLFNYTFKKCEKVLKDREKEIHAVKESFCMVENCLYSETELRFISDMQIAMEATDNNDEKPKINAVEVSSSSSENNDNTETNTDTSDTTKKGDKEIFMKNYGSILQLTQGAMMTVLEERYSISMKILRAVVSEMDKASGKKEETDKEKTPEVNGDKPEEEPNRGTGKKKKKKK